MGQLTLSISYQVNTGDVFSPAEIYSLYLYGIDIQAANGTAFSDESMSFYIRSAQMEVENWFKVKFAKQLIDRETTSYYRDDYWQQFPIIRTKYPVRKPLSLTGLLGNIEQITYPESWLRSTQTSSNQNKRRISVVPTGSSSVQVNSDIILTGITSQIGMQRFENIPDYWDFQYITGFDLDALPYDLFDIVGKMACFGPLGIAGDLILGAGIASQSLSVDGLSQSISSTASATSSGYNARLIQYKKEIEESVKRLMLIYSELTWVAL